MFCVWLFFSKIMLSGEWFYVIGVLISLKIINDLCQRKDQWQNWNAYKRTMELFFFLSSNYHKVSKNMTNMICYKAGLFLYTLSLRPCFFFTQNFKTIFKCISFLTCFFLSALESQMPRMCTARNHNPHSSKNSLTSNQSK